MTRPRPEGAAPLLRDVLVFQFKLLIDALRDLVLSPLTISAGLLDLLLLRRQSPRYFFALLRLGRRTEEWIDLWAAAFEREASKPANVDALLASLEQAVRDPQSGARRARVLKRWAEMSLARQRRREAGMPPGV
jgi:hypothetical protein